MLLQQQKKSMNSGAKCKVSWTQEEDKLLLTLVKRYGTINWSKMADELEESFGGIKKSGKQCRQRWFNHLDPNIIKKQWSLQQQNLLFQKHREHGNRWIQIAQSLPGRTDNAIKNHFYSTIRKSLRRMNKFLGSKDGTTKIRKIKPSTLSYIFSSVNNEAENSSDKKNKKNLQISSTREAAYHLINFSCWKLNDSKKKVHSSEIEKLEKLLEEVDRINNIRHQECEEAEKERKLETNSELLGKCLDLQAENIEALDYQFQQSYQKLIQLETKSNKRSRKRSAAITSQTETLNAKQNEAVCVNNSSLNQREQPKETQKNNELIGQVNRNEVQEFDFNLSLQQENYPEINHPSDPSGYHHWTYTTPSINTPLSVACKNKININQWFALEESNMESEVICQGQWKVPEGKNNINQEKFREGEEINFNVQYETQSCN